MNFTVEHTYCVDTFKENDTRFLIQETVDFSRLNNPLFLARPEWLRVATCISAFVFPVGYFFILVAAFLDVWNSVYVCVPCLLFVGMKCYGIFYYHIMEFLSTTPPTNLVPYFSVEGPYIVSLALVLTKCFDGLYFAMNSDEIVRKAVKEEFEKTNENGKGKKKNN